MNLREAREIGEGALKEAGIGDASADARLMLEWVTGISMTEYALNPFRKLTEEQEAVYLDLIGKRKMRIPLQHLTGEQEFMGFSFQVNPGVLIPRQETELLAEAALKLLKPGMRVLDLCTGSGCIIISLEQIGRRQEKADRTNRFTGSDISPAAIRTAAANAGRHGAQVSFLESDLFDRIQDRYDMIISNPPYIRTAVIAELEEEVRCHDPVLALDGREDGLYFYRRIIREAEGYLNPGGRLLFEIGYDQKEEVTKLLEQNGYREIRVQKDLAGLDRVVIGRYDRV